MLNTSCTLYIAYRILVSRIKDFTLGILVYNIGHNRVQKITVYSHYSLAVTVYISNNYVTKTILEVVTVSAECTANNRVAIRRGIGDAVNYDIVNMRASGKKSYRVAQIRVSAYIADCNIVNVAITLCPVVVHKIGRAHV